MPGLKAAFPFQVHLIPARECQEYGSSSDPVHSPSKVRVTPMVGLVCTYRREDILLRSSQLPIGTFLHMISATMTRKKSSRDEDIVLDCNS